MSRTTLILAALALVATGCAKKNTVREIEVSKTTPTAANLNLDAELLRRCSIQIGVVERAPKFDFDEAALLPEDRDVLEQVAKCVTTGPLRGRKLALVGRADPRGEVEYNMALGDHRADAVRTYLTHLGVNEGGISQTSRGELDAEGKDEAGWRMDRRVDLLLASD
jgi:peptidoglycan-associated lipoprotein